MDMQTAQAFASKMYKYSYWLQTPESPAFIPSLGWTIFDPRGSVVLSAVFDQPKMLTPKEAATISLRDFARLWRVSSSLRRLIFGLLPWPEIDCEYNSSSQCIWHCSR